MATVNYTLRLDETDKRQAEQIFKSFGLTFSAGVNAYIKTVVRQRRIPLDLDLTAKTSAMEAAASEREKSFMALRGILSGHDVDLDKEREERILSR